MKKYELLAEIRRPRKWQQIGRQVHRYENLLNREFHADKPNTKWVTDISYIQTGQGVLYLSMIRDLYNNSIVVYKTATHQTVDLVLDTIRLAMRSVHKLCLSAILDLYDRRIVSFVLRDANDSALVHETLDQALAANPDAHPLFHSDRGFQYTTRVFHDKLAAAGMTQSMSRVGKCIDNGPMEGFWGILKRERYYGRKFTSREQLDRMIREYIAYYNFSRLQRRLGVHTPMEVFTQYRAA